MPKSKKIRQEEEERLLSSTKEHADHDSFEKANKPSNASYSGVNHEEEGSSTDEEEQVWTPEKGKRRTITVGRSRRRCMLIAAVVLILILGGAIFARPMLLSTPPTVEGEHADENLTGYDPHKILSNGTHIYQKTVLLVSIDGLRASYLDWGLTPHLLHISKRGVRSKYMKPSFPTITFPNHWTLLTGLYPESHGIVANNFWDPSTESEFKYSDPKMSWNGSWWGGESIWETARKQNMLTANLMWPGPPVTVNGIAPSYFVPFEDSVSMDVKVQQIVNWLELPFEARPRLITAYEPSLDHAGHIAGPDSELVRIALTAVDEFARQVHESILARNLTHIVDVIYVSDHGMTDTSEVEMIYLDDIIGEDGVNEIEHEDGWPLVGMWFSKDADQTQYLTLLEEAAKKNPEAFGVYTHETMPERWHFNSNPRIAPIYAIPSIGWAFTNHHEHKKGTTWSVKGNHGYDNDDPRMRAMFVADGPFARRVSEKLRKRETDTFLGGLSRRLLGSRHDAKDTIIEGFPNVELNNLVQKILGLNGPPNNGTKGFWEQYI